MKMHLAGVVAIDSRSTWQALKDSYRSQSPATILRNKAQNIAFLLGPRFFDCFGLSTASRLAQRDYIFNATGAMDAAWLVVPFLLIRRNARRAVPHAGLLIRVAVVNLLIWALAMFGPAQTFTAHGSYADILILCTGLLGFLLLLHPAILAALFALGVANFFAWVFFKPVALPLPNNVAVLTTLHWPLLIMGLLCAAALIWHFGKSYFQAVCHTRG